MGASEQKWRLQYHVKMIVVILDKIWNVMAAGTPPPNIYENEDLQAPRCPGILMFLNVSSEWSDRGKTAISM